jgi:NADH-quinone oxidoreductase subunit G
MSLEVAMVKIRIDGKYYEAQPGKNLLETALAIGLDIPHFCYHPALGSVGACRLCAVKKFRDDKDVSGRIVMSCMEPVAEGLIVSIRHKDAEEFRAAVIEGLMLNHPHDCPVCDEGGECHLQDMTVMTGHNYRRFDFKKRTYKNQDLGPYIAHEMNRCIQCYRCVRFYRDYAGGKDLNVFGAHDHVYFGRYEDGILESEFSGNLVEVCPTGVFTDKTLNSHYTRKWDLTNAPSICTHCSVGCNIIVSERYGSVRRVMSRYNGAVNGYFICDRGRFGYGFVNSDDRIRKPEMRISNDKQEKVDNERLDKSLQTLLSPNNKIIGIGSPLASVESNFALSVLAGEGNFYHGISKNEQVLTKTVMDFLQKSGVRTPSLKQMEKADAIVVLGENLTETAPMIALALRQAVRKEPNAEAALIGIPLWNDSPVRELAQDTRSPLYIATPFKDKLDDISAASFRASYQEIAGLGSAIASSISDSAPVKKLIKDDHQKLAERIAISLKNSKNPLIISGVNCADEDVIHAAMNIATALLSEGKSVMLSMVLPEADSMGLAMIPGKPLDDVFNLDNEEMIDTLVILENDLYSRAAAELVDLLFKRCRKIIVLDHLPNNTTRKADIVLPAATFAESEGTFVNNEGRAQRFYQALPDNGQVKASWQWIGDLLKIREKKHAIPWNRFDDIAEMTASTVPAFSKLLNYKPDADFRMLNMKMPRQTVRFSGRTAISANIMVSEPRIPQDNDSPLAFTMEGRPETPPSSMVPFYWSPGWNSVQAMYRYLHEPNGSMKGGDPGIRLIEPPESFKPLFFKKTSSPI